jgi:hypothetical protein
MTSHGAKKRFLIRAERVFVLCAALAAACAAPGDLGQGITDISSPAVSTPTEPKPTGPTPGGPYTLSGVLTLRTPSGTSPLANARVGGYLIKTSGESYGMAPVLTDADGRYAFLNVYSGSVVLYADAPHAYLPCAAIGKVNGANGVKDLELLDSATTRPATPADSPTLSGAVYRKTAAGRQPVAGAVIEYEYPPVIATTTITDAQGRYSLCRLPLGRGGLDVWLNGVHLGGVVVNITGDDVLDMTW